MGLDVTAYRKLTPAPDGVDEHGGATDGHVRLSDIMEEHFPGRMEGIAPGVYSTADEFDFRAGSYGGYNEWRDELARLAGHSSARHVWSLIKVNPALKGPFVELINFADNEGVIGPIVAAKLARDFTQFIGEAEARGGWFLDRYRFWQRAFEMAADGGAVDFH